MTGFQIVAPLIPTPLRGLATRIPRDVASSAILTIAVAAFLASFANPALADSRGNADGTTVIAVVRDGTPAGADIASEIEEELAKHLPPGAAVIFEEDAAFDAGWQPSQARGSLAAALEDSRIDLVLVTGVLVTSEAASMELTKPVVSAFAQRFDVFQLPYMEEDRSARANLALIVLPQRARRDVEAFRALVPFGSLHILVGAEELTHVTDLEDQLRAVGVSLGVTIEIVPLSTDVDGFFAGLDPGVEAVYLTDLPRLASASRDHLIAGLSERRIPTFSLRGYSDVERGALGSLTPDTRQQIVRRVALNLSRLIRGEATSDLPVLVHTESRLLINARTAVALGLSLGPEVRMFGTFLHEEMLEQAAEPLSLAGALRLAESQNTALAIQGAATESLRQDVEISRSFLLPQIFADVSYLSTDSGFALSGAGIGSDGSTQGLLSLDQMIYDDRTVSDYRSVSRLAEGSEEVQEAARLDALAEAGSDFLNLALAQAIYEVELQNLRLSENHLELSLLREEVGYSGHDEVLRWQAVVADERSALFRGSETVETARIALNQTLSVEQDRRWRLEEIAVEAEVVPFLGGRLTSAFAQGANRHQAREAFTMVALENAHEIRAIDKGAEAQQIQLDRAQRAYFLPSFFARATYASEISSGDESFPGFEDDSYALTLNLSYPIFQGLRRRGESAKATVELQGLELQLQLARELVERRMRTAIRRVEGSFPRIRFSRQSAEAATANLVIVQDKYAEGIVNVTDLLSAQTGKFDADRLATVSEYELLLDLIDLQRALSFFEGEKASQESAALAKRIEEAMSTP